MRRLQQLVRSSSIFICVLSLILFSNIFASAEADGNSQAIGEGGFHWQVQKHTLENGLTVLITEMPSSSVLNINALVKVGSATEGQYLGTGISHFVEHMLFKGTQKRGVGEISKEVQSFGGSINASTTFDRTLYTIDAPKGTFEKALDIMADMVMNSQFADEEVEKERKVIFGEMRLYYDNPVRQLSRYIFENVFIRHPYRHPIIGYEPLLANLSREDLWDFYKSQYIPNNMILSIAGAVTAEEILPQIKEAFQDFAPKPYLAPVVPEEPAQISSRWVEKEFATKITRLALAYQSTSLLDKDLYALDVLAMILGQGRSSRLYQELLKEKELVQSIGAGNYTPQSKGVFQITSVLQPENILETVSAIQDEIEQIKRKGVYKQELARAKRQVLSGHIFGQQTASAMSYSMAINEAMLGDYDFSRKYVEAIRAVSSDDIQKVAQKYLVDQNLTVVVLKPKQKKSVSPAKKEAAAEIFIEKFVLDNGLTVLLRKDPTFPLVSLRLSLHGGTRQESESLNGLSNLSSQVWIKGTRTRSARDIAESVESRGGSLSSFSGRQSLGLEFDLLAEDLEFGLDLLADLIENPTFPVEEINQQKEIVKTAIKAQKDRIFTVAWKALRETLFLEHSLRWDTLGTLDSVENISREDIVEFSRNLSVPNNMVLSVFGDFDQSEVKNIIKKQLASLAFKKIHLKKEKEFPPDQPRTKTVYVDKTQAVVMIGFQAPTLQDDEKYAMQILASVLGSPLSGRIFLTVRDELGKSYSLGGSFLPTISTGVAYFYVITTDEDVEKVRDILLEQIEEIRNADISDEELKNAKEYLKGRHQMGLQTNASRSLRSSLDELYGLGFDHYKDYVESIERVTKEDVRDLAQEFFSPQRTVVVMARPKSDAEEAPEFNQ